MLSRLEEAYQADIRIRREFSPTLSAKQVSIAAKKNVEGVVYDEGGVRVTAFRVKHADIEEAFGSMRSASRGRKEWTRTPPKQR